MPVVNAQVRETWRKAMVKTPRPKNGCFKVEYPSTEWQEVQCGRPSPYMNSKDPRRGKAEANTVGHGADYVVQAYGSNLISSSEGSFLPIAGGSSTAGLEGYLPGPNPPTSACTPGSGCVANVFELQMNTQSEFNRIYNLNPYPSNFSTPACNGAPNGASGCYGWQQFLYSQTQGLAPVAGQQSLPGAPGTTPGLFIEYWLMNWGTPCPALPSWAGTGKWIADGLGDCWFNGPMTYVPPQTAAELPGLVMTSSASASEDTVTLSTTSGLYTYQEPNVLSLSKAWTQVEFNIFGDCCSTEVTFTSPTVLVLNTSIDDGSPNAPSCVANDGTTGERNSLTFEPNASPVCCPYGGSSPAIQFAEDYDTSKTHTASCGATQIQGDTHIVTANGTHYNFQGAGEYVTLLDPDGAEIQTRQSPVASTTTINDPSEDDGLATCVSINTAVAARVGSHRVTYEPCFSGACDASGLQLRIDGKVTTLGAQGVNLGNGGRVVNSTAGSGTIEVNFPDGKILTVTPDTWTAPGETKAISYLNVDIGNLYGIMSEAGGASVSGLSGAVPNGSWLPALPGGASVGSMPASLSARYNTLYNTFGNAWRVTKSNSLFDYAPGTSTATYTMTSWPPENPPCSVPNQKPITPVSAAVAEEACKSITDTDLKANCVFDVQVTGNSGFARTYAVTQRVHTVLNIKPITIKPVTIEMK
jgi:hypothetical protein